jgi:hypothetical protein
MIRWSEFMPTAAIGFLAVICLPMFVVALPFYFIGRGIGRWLESHAA